MSTQPRYAVSVNGKTLEATVSRVSGDSIDFEVAGVPYHVSVGVAFLPAGPSVSSSSFGAVSNAPGVIPLPSARMVERPSARASGPFDGSVRAPMPGIVVSVLVKEGDMVVAGQTVAIIEAMKMENNISAAASGVVGSIQVSAGKEVELGQVILSLVTSALKGAA